MIIPGYPLTGHALLARLSNLKPCSIEDAALQCGYALFFASESHPCPDVNRFQAALKDLSIARAKAA